MKLISPEYLRVTTPHGAAVVFEPNVEYEVGSLVGVLALQQGAKLVEDAPTVAQQVIETPVEEIAISDVVEDKLDRLIAEDKHDRLVAVMRDIYIEGNPGDFKISDNTPKAAVVARKFGESVPADEREKAWEEALRS
tara:strand:+ start:5531 stop:5941 length:411 start_codon:yes stop_codon:yes gene_type:complete